MKVDRVESKIKQQLSYMKSISNAYPNLIKVKPEDITKHRIDIRLNAVKEDWLHFFNNHEAIILDLAKVDSDARHQLESHAYFKEGSYSVTYECYLETLERMTSLREKQLENTIQSSSSTPSLLSLTPVSIYHSTRLPRIDLPKFNGALSDWISFKVLFTSLVHSNPTISSVEKLQYLKTSLVESAAHLVRNIALTDENFSKASDAVISFYENRRLLVNAALQSLFSIKEMSQESVSEIERLYTSTMQVYQSLEALQRPIQQWDDILIFVTIQRLDSESVKMWEQHLGSSKEPPDWNSFREFLMTRMLSLQAFEHSHPEKSSSRNSRTIARSHFSSAEYKDQGHGTRDTACPLCSEMHTIHRCPQYHKKTPEQRRKVVTSNNLCFNCLGAHRSSLCRSTRRCINCGQHHHTSLHHTGLNSNREARVRGQRNSTSMTSDLETKQVNHVYQDSETISTTLLATARVKVINDHNKTLEVLTPPQRFLSGLIFFRN